MSWNNSSIFQNTRYSALFRNRQAPDALRWRIALTYAVAFFLTTLLCFVLIYLTQRHVHYKTMRKRLTTSADVLEVEYIRGTPLKKGEDCTYWERLAEVKREKIMARYPGFKPWYVIKKQNSTSDVIGSLDGETVAISIQKKVLIPGKPQPMPKTGNRILLKTEFQEEVSDERSYPFIFLHLSKDHSVLSSTPMTSKSIQYLIEEENENQTPTSKDIFSTLERGHHKQLLHKRHLYDGTLLIAGLDTSDAKRSLRHLLVLFSIAIVIVPFIGGSVGWLVGLKISNGIRRVTKSARKIRNSGNYTGRVQHGTEGREINELIDAFNAMVERTEVILTELKTISDNVIHDLRTPITRLRGKAELAIREDGRNELASDIAEECANMLDMINTQLEISQIESGVAGKKNEPVNLSSIVENIADLYSVIAEDAGLEMVVRTPEMPVSITGSKTKLQRLVANLLDNAIKYTSPGGRVTIDLKVTNENTRLSVTDTGCGIDTEDLKHIFDRFYRADSSRTRPGNGLGLCLVKAIVDSHNGTISAISEIDRGTSFIVTFPVKTPEK